MVSPLVRIEWIGELTNYPKELNSWEPLGLMESPGFHSAQLLQGNLSFTDGLPLTTVHTFIMLIIGANWKMVFTGQFTSPRGLVSPDLSTL
jgi:hypothetical protein